jgi:hypothetical protein
MSESRPGPSAWWTARRLVAEFVLILAGVLTALFVDTWWKARDERELERAYLMQLLTDMRANELALDRAIAGYTESRTRTGRLLVTFRDPTQRPSLDSLVLWSRMFAPVFEPVTGTLRGLLETGQIRLVRNEPLRRAIIAVDAEIASVVARVARNETRNGELVEVRTQRMVANLPPGRIVADPGSIDEVSTGWWRSIDYARLLRDPVAHATFQTLYYVQGNSMSALNRLRAPYATLRSLLEREVATP